MVGSEFLDLGEVGAEVPDSYVQGKHELGSWTPGNGVWGAGARTPDFPSSRTILYPADPLPPIPLDFPGSFDVLSPSPDSEGLSSVFSSSLPSPTNSSSPSPRDPTDSLDWLEALSGGPPLGSGPPPPSIFSADLSDSSSSRLWDLLEDPW